MFSVFLAIALLFVTFAYLKAQKAQQGRIVTQRGLPREELLPGHYKSFVDVEKKLWEAAGESERSAKWDTTRIRLRPAESLLVREYVHGLSKDFEIGDRIFAVVISHSPEVEILRQLEWHRAKIEFSYYRWYLLISIRLWTGWTSPAELQRLTQVVATLAYEVRSMLNVFERSGHFDFVESILKNY